MLTDSEIKRNVEHELAWEADLSATGLGDFEIRCGPSCTPRYDPTP